MFVSGQPGREGAALAVDVLPEVDAVVVSAEQRLRCHSYLALKNISCRFDDGTLVLEGCVPSYYLKQMAQEAVSHMEGVERIDNRVQVLASGLN